MQKESRPVKILTVPGMNIIAPLSCNGCNHLSNRRTCSKWAFPETKWAGHNCPDYSPQSLTQ